MDKNKSPSALSQAAGAAAPDVRLRFLGLPRDVALLVCLVIFVAVGGAIWALALRRAPDAAGPQAPTTTAQGVCARFVQRKNAGDPALDMIGPPPTVPDHAVSPEEAEHIQADFFLHQDVHFAGVGLDKTTGALVLYARGNVSAPTLRVKTATGEETVQRTMSNPDLTVEVRDGQIWGMAANLHREP